MINEGYATTRFVCISKGGRGNFTLVFIYFSMWNNQDTLNWNDQGGVSILLIIAAF